MRAAHCVCIQSIFSYKAIGNNEDVYCCMDEIWPIETVDIHGVDVIWNSGFRGQRSRSQGDVTYQQ